jgi:tripartite motif-containing protein 71
MIVFSQSVGDSVQDSSRINMEQWILARAINGEDSPSGKFLSIPAIDLDPQGNLYIVDSGRNRLLKYSPDGYYIEDVGGFGNGPHQFNDPRDVDAHLALSIYIADYNNNRVVRLDSRMYYLSDFKTSLDSPYYFEMPLSVAVDNQYDIFILEDLHKRVVKFNRFDQPQVAFGKSSENLGQLLGPYQIAAGQKNILYVSDSVQGIIVMFDFLGNYLNQIEHPDMIEPRGIHVSARGELAIADHRGRKIFFYRQGGKFFDLLDLSPADIKPTDVALWHPMGRQDMVLYVSDSDKCYIFYRQ